MIMTCKKKQIWKREVMRENIYRRLYVWTKMSHIVLQIASGLEDKSQSLHISLLTKQNPVLSWSRLIMQLQ